ncbi:MAG: ArsA family ATPase [Actinobacteria bacterium]|nr:ArsA family ATPase [Actinomycetota bacterium]
MAGKGGVGKTTLSAALARMASKSGLSVLVVEIEGKHGLAAAFGTRILAYDEQVLSPGGGGEGEIRARTLTPDQALLEYLDEHGLRRISRRLTRSGAVDVVATAAPGIKDILLLGKVKQLEQRREADLIILDAPAAGHAVTFLLSARSLLDTVNVGPIRTQAEEVLALLTDPARSQVMLVTLPEETPVNEVVETAYTLEEEVGIDLGPVVVNGLYADVDGLDVDPEEAANEADVALRPGEAQALGAAARFRAGRQRLQSEQLARLAEALPLPQLQVPALFTAGIGRAEVDVLAAALAESVAALEAVEK